MRIDKFLKVSADHQAAHPGEGGLRCRRVQINGRVAKAGTEVKPEDTVFIDFGRRS